ncbi:MAG: hypothetical protein PHY43_03960 [Verrucomicrobiales bacterium]|nr:hypothetical protein [Verrucomicrobiales bacterium]
MSKPIVFQLEFSGYQNLKIEEAGIERPPTAEEFARAIASELEFRCYEPGGKKLQVKVKRIS